MVDSNLAEKLKKQDLLEDLPSGEKGVRCSVQYRAKMQVASRAARSQLLNSQFQTIRPMIEGMGGKLDLTSLSVSGQTVEALLPLKNVDEIQRRLQAGDFRVDLVIPRRVTE